ncbi:DUF559 domain-containing protein [Pseudonocardia kunmingensis]|uniref:Very-short-patch-repair endonuclease n=1 Tax=Pseudonocardia kunmingensis TaxID=630975 RepID=A0A543E4J4_9PSEU|nr:DUF559 domain-containing protein [Pseudonocardia kunmingensis]TQM16389.1 very-short-patch-repair endonuclease [Pseudonocardia kunmingensis]
MSIDPTRPFRASAAVAAGLLTWSELRGPRFQKLFPDVYAPAHLEPTLAVRSRAAAVLVAGRGVVAGYSAAELLRASSGPTDAPAEVLMLRSGGQSYRSPGLRVHRDLVDPTETTEVDGCAVTNAARTAFDLARWVPSLVEKVVAVDVLAYKRDVTHDDLVRLRLAHPGAWGARHLSAVLRHATNLAESPMETRIRMALWAAGLPPPTLQFAVPAGGKVRRLDLAYPEVKLAIEYDGEDHRRQDRARRDLEREAALVALGWLILRFDAGIVHRRPDLVARTVAFELRRRGLLVS